MSGKKSVEGRLTPPQRALCLNSRRFHTLITFLKIIPPHSRPHIGPMSAQALLRGHVRLTVAPAQPSLPARRAAPIARPSLRDIRVRAEAEPQPSEIEVRLRPGAPM